MKGDSAAFICEGTNNATLVVPNDALVVPNPCPDLGYVSISFRASE